MVGSNLAFKLISLNARGIHPFEKRKAVFGWLLKQKVDLCFLQETIALKKEKNIWKKQWMDEMFFSHGSDRSRGVLILINNSLEFELISVRSDKEGRFIFLEVFVQDQKLFFVNIYAPQQIE